MSTCSPRSPGCQFFFRRLITRQPSNEDFALPGVPDGCPANAAPSPFDSDSACRSGAAGDCMRSEVEAAAARSIEDAVMSVLCCIDP